jgi:hypothetical protein
MNSVYTVEDYLAMKNKVQTHSGAWRNLENSMVCERSQSQKTNVSYESIYMKIPKEDRFTPVMLVTKEVEISRMAGQGQTRQKISETSSQSISQMHRGGNRKMHKQYLFKKYLKHQAFLLWEWLKLQRACLASTRP